MKIFVPITKVDVEKREVWGRAVAEVPDRANEIFDYESSVPYFKNWSAAFEKATESLPEPSLGNIRAMHGKVAAGKVIAIDFNDAEKAIDIGAKIVDDNEWQKVLEGVYTGFSIGGKYIKKWKDAVVATLTRYTADPAETSLVDFPCVPTAQFACVKADGASETKSFQHYGLLKAAIDAPELTVGELFRLAMDYLPSDSLAKADVSIDDIRGELRSLVAQAPAADAGTTDAAAAVSEAEKIAARSDVDPKAGEAKYGDDTKFADPKNKKYPIDTEQHIRAAWNYINKQKNADKYSADDLKTIKDRIVAAWKKVIGSDGPPSAADTAKFAAFQADALAKGMYSVSNLADIIQSIYYVAMESQYEADWEQDGSLVPEQLKAWLQLGAEIVKDMAEEEANELVAQLRQQAGDNVVVVETIATLAAAATTGDLAKTGKRHSAADQKLIQGMHDSSVALGAGCGTDDADKAAPVDELAKAELATTLEKLGALEKAVTDLTAERETLAKRITELEALPLPPKGVTRAVEKIDDAAGSAATAPEKIEPDPKNPIAVMRAVHATGGARIAP